MLKVSAAGRGMLRKFEVQLLHPILHDLWPLNSHRLMQPKADRVEMAALHLTELQTCAQLMPPSFANV